MTESYSFKFRDGIELNTTLGGMQKIWGNKHLGANRLHYAQRYNAATHTFSGPVTDLNGRVAGWITYRSRCEDGSAVMTLSDFHLDPTKSADFKKLVDIVTQRAEGSEILPVEQALAEEVHDLNKPKREPRKRAKSPRTAPTQGAPSSTHSL